MKRLHATLRANVAINVTAICNDTCNVAEVGTISTFGTLQETLPATPAKPVTRSNFVVACNVACNVSSCDSALMLIWAGCTMQHRAQYCKQWVNCNRVATIEIVARNILEEESSSTSAVLRATISLNFIVCPLSATLREMSYRQLSQLFKFQPITFQLSTWTRSPACKQTK